MPADEGPSEADRRQAFEKMFKLAFDPEMMRTVQAIRAVADFDIPADRQAVFMRFHTFITKPQPRYVTTWRESLETERWYHQHVNGVLGDVRTGLAAAHYHAERLAELERQVREVLAASSLSERMDNGSGMGLGGTRRMDLEYQAFVLGFRRCLDYLAGALASYFKTECQSFRTLPRTLRKAARPDAEAVAAAISEAHGRHVEGLAFVLAEGRASVRNKVAHYNAVSAGVINLNARGFFIAGGGEELSYQHVGPPQTLAAVLAARLDLLHACLVDVIDSFIEAVRQREERG